MCIRDSPYSLPLSGAGFETSVSSLTLQDIKDYYRRWVVPHDAVISVVGDVTMDEIKSKLTEKLKGWVGKSEKNNSKKLFQKLESKKILYLLHKPEAVSYTHLDVYKRQVEDWAEADTSRPLEFNEIEKRYLIRKSK